MKETLTLRVHLNERDVPYMKPEKKKVVKFQLEKEWKWLEFHRKIFREGVIIDTKWNSKVAALLRNNWEMLQRSRVTVTQEECESAIEKMNKICVVNLIYLQEFIYKSFLWTQKGTVKWSVHLETMQKR